MQPKPQPKARLQHKYARHCQTKLMQRAASHNNAIETHACQACLGRHAATHFWTNHLDMALASACLDAPRTHESNNDIHAGAANGARTKNKHTIAATHFAAAIASTAACRSTPNFAPTRALGALRCALVAACIPRALATFAASCAASWAAPNPHEAPTCRKSATNAARRDEAATTKRAALDALPAACGSYSPMATLKRTQRPMPSHCCYHRPSRWQRDAHGELVARVCELSSIAATNCLHTVVRRAAGQSQAHVPIAGSFDLARRLQLKGGSVWPARTQSDNAANQIGYETATTRDQLRTTRV